MKFLSVLILLSGLILSGCSHQSHGDAKKLMAVKVEDVRFNKTHAKKYKHVYVSGQPYFADFKAMKKKGVKVVVNMRSSKDKHYSKKQYDSEKRVAEGLGIKYYTVPMNPCKPSREVFDKVEEILKENKGEQTLVHCSSGNRAAAWFADHMKNQHGLSTKQALAKAKEMGLTKKNMIATMQYHMSNKGHLIGTELQHCRER